MGLGDAANSRKKRSARDSVNSRDLQPHKDSGKSQHMASCLRCPSTELEALPSPEGITYYLCPACGRQFAQKPGEALTERWLGALREIVYSVIFSEHPQDEAAREAAWFKSYMTREHLAFVVSQIRAEIDHPTQNVREILPGGMCASEQDLREYLSRVADILSADSPSPSA
jgi:hypothetical protein